MKGSAPNLSGYEPVAVIRKEPDELAAARALVFEERHDDLDRVRECMFAGPSGALFALVRHANAPKPGTQLLVQARSLPHATELLVEAVDALGLTMPDLSWIRRELWAGMSAASEKRAAERKDAEAATRAALRGKTDGAARKAAGGPVRADPALAKVVGDGEMTRQQVTRKVWSYIKRKGLQDKKNRRMINADDALRSVFGGKSQVDMSTVPKLVDKHVKRVR